MSKPHPFILSTPQSLMPSKEGSPGRLHEDQNIHKETGSRMLGRERMQISAVWRQLPGKLGHTALWEGEKGAPNLICRNHRSMPPVFLIRKRPARGLPSLASAHRVADMCWSRPPWPPSPIVVSHMPSSLVSDCSHWSLQVPGL